MKSNRWLDLSQRVYTRLLRLYPQSRRAEYEMEMTRLFTTQCRDAFRQRGVPGILSLWPRTLADLVVTAIREHLSEPRARLGLLDAAPDEPLPWKGVLLVLIPGLVFFAGQVAQVTTTEDWFFVLYYRAAFFLILPVLAAWLFTRRFPVWGLIPAGLLYETLWVHSLPLFNNLGMGETLVLFNQYQYPLDTKYFLGSAACLLLLAALLVYLGRRRQIPRGAWKWLGLYGLLTLFQIGIDAWQSFGGQGWDLLTALGKVHIRQYLVYMPFWYLFDSLSFLLLVVGGMLFARKYGGWSFMLLLGFLLPTIIFGRYGAWSPPVPFLVVSAAVLLYRFVVALAAPIWLVRAASVRERQRAAAIPVAIAILSKVSINLAAFLAYAAQNNYRTGPLDFALVIWDQVITAAGLGLAMALYLPADGHRTEVATDPATAAAQGSSR